MHPKRILIADKQALSLAGTKALLAEHDQAHLVGTVTRYEALEEALDELKPDILIIDYSLGGEACLETLAKLSTASTGTSLFLLSSENDKSLILRALQLSVPVYVTKDCSEQEIHRAIEASLKGEKFYCQKILNLILEKHAVHAAEAVENGLTTREKEVLALLAKGKQTQAVAELLYLSPHTVHTHRKSIIKKLNIKSPTEFVVRAMDLGLV